MNERRLRYALTVWRERSFSEAAKRHGISQPSVSEHITNLEAELGFKLFRRTGRGVVVTYAGRTYLEHAETAVKASADLQELAERLRGGLGGSISIGITSNLTGFMLPRLIGSLGDMLKDWRLEAITATSRRIQRFVSQDRIDAGLAIVVKETSLPDNVVQHEVDRMPLNLLMPKGIADTSCDDSPGLKVLDHCALIAHETDIGFGEMVFAGLADRGIRPRIVAQADDMETVVLLVSSGVGSAIVPATLAREAAAAGAGDAHDLGNALDVGVALLHRRRTFNEAHRKLIALLRERLSQSPTASDRGAAHQPSRRTPPAKARHETVELES